eukprot:7128850-Pyramimonas_sp.AAC.2
MAESVGASHVPPRVRYGILCEAHTYTQITSFSVSLTGSLFTHRSNFPIQNSGNIQQDYKAAQSRLLTGH